MVSEDKPSVNQDLEQPEQCSPEKETNLSWLYIAGAVTVAVVLGIILYMCNPPRFRSVHITRHGDPVNYDGVLYMRTLFMNLKWCQSIPYLKEIYSGQVKKEEVEAEKVLQFLKGSTVTMAVKEQFGGKKVERNKPFALSDYFPGTDTSIPDKAFMEKCKEELLRNWKVNNFVTVPESHRGIYHDSTKVFAHYPLDVKGVKDAIQTARRHFQVGVCNTAEPVIWSSPMMRTLQTAKIIQFALQAWSGKPVKLSVVPHLMEISTNVTGVKYGDLPELRFEYPEDLRTNTQWPIGPGDKHHQYLLDSYQANSEAPKVDPQTQFWALQSQYLANREASDKPGQQREKECLRSTETRELKATKSNQWWKKHQPNYVADKAKPWKRLVYPHDAPEDPLKTSEVRTFTPESPFEFQWREGGYKPETYSDFAHRLFRVIEKAVQHTGDAILVAHCDLLGVSMGYPQFVREFGKKDYVPDPACPRPGAKDFPWFALDKKFRNAKYIGKGLNPVKAGTVTLKFASAKASPGRYPTSEPLVEYWQPGWEPTMYEKSRRLANVRSCDFIPKGMGLASRVTSWDDVSVLDYSDL